jgi:Icc-related predicted phosphoesterase
MRTCLHISDTHEENIYEIVKKHCLGHPLKFHILFITGDLTYRGFFSAFEKARDQMDQILAEGFVEDIVWIPGNHDRSLEETHAAYENVIGLFRNPLVTNIHLLIHEAKVVQGIKIFGSPWTPWFFDWAFNYYNPRFPSQSEGLIKGHELWADIPYDTQILMTHGPVAYILDTVKRNKEHVGCEDLLRTVRSLPALRVFLCGHIHEAYGRQQVGDVLYLNSSIMNLEYLNRNKPQEFDFYMES